jgi:hypothetical protein
MCVCVCVCVGTGGREPTGETTGALEQRVCAQDAGTQVCA